MKTLIFLLSLILLSGCAAVIDQKVYIQNMSVQGPIHTPPMSIIDKNSAGKLVFSPKIYINPSSSLRGNLFHTLVNEKGVYQLDTIRNGYNISYNESSKNQFQYKGENIQWDLPNFAGGADIQLPIQEKVNVDVGINYSDFENFSLLGGHIGFCFYSIREHNSASFSLGLHAQEMYYNASTVVITTIDEAFGPTHTVLKFYNDRDKDWVCNIYASFMVNYFYDFINFNIAGSFFSQSAFNYKSDSYNPDYYFFNNSSESDGAKVSEYGTFLSLTPGVYTYLNDMIRLSGSINIVYELGNLNPISNNPVLLIPCFKLDFIF